VVDVTHTQDLQLEAVVSRADLAGLLQTVRSRADDPSLRALEVRTRHASTPLSRSVVSEMLRGIRFPRKGAMLAFLRACGVPEEELETWRCAWDRVNDIENRYLTDRVERSGSTQTMKGYDHDSLNLRLALSPVFFLLVKLEA
jgi:hypothetical protein